METDCKANPKRVLLLAEGPYFGGITSHLLAIVEAFRDTAGFAFTMATLPGRRDDTTLIDTCRERGIPIHVFPMSWAYDVRLLGALKRFVRAGDFDLIHTHNYRATLVCALAAGGTPIVNTFHGAVGEPSWRLTAWQWAERRAMRRHRLTIACSQFVREYLANRGLAPDRLRTVYNGFSPLQAQESAITRASLGIPEDRLVVLYMGRLAPGKGIEHLLDALAGLPQATGIIAGDGPARGGLEAKAGGSALDMHFAGKVSEPGQYYRLADVVVLPSRMEALPMALIEAAAYGKPVVATRVGGIPEVVRDGETGFLVEYGDLPALREALLRCADGGVRAAMGEKARARWQAEFTLGRMAEQLGQAYTEALRG